MCHISKLSLCAGEKESSVYSGAVSARCYFSGAAARRIAVLPDIYGVTPFYRGLSSFLSDKGANVYLVNPWEPYGDLPEMTRDAAWTRRHLIRDRAFCDDVAAFLEQERIDTLIGFCIGGNYLFELVRRGYRGTCCAFYPLPWGMANEDGLQPPFEFMVQLERKVTILTGEDDPLAGPENTAKLRAICARNPRMELHLYESSGHGFLADIDSEEAKLRNNARNALEVMLDQIFPDPDGGPGPHSSGGRDLLPAGGARA